MSDMKKIELRQQVLVKDGFCVFTIVIQLFSDLQNSSNGEDEIDSSLLRTRWYVVYCRRIVGVCYSFVL